MNEEPRVFHEGSDRLRPGVATAASRDHVLLRLKAWAKRSPALFTFLAHWTCAFVGVTARQAIAHIPQGSRILNLGSGVRQVRADVVNVDYDAFPGVQVVADVYALPFEDASVDAIVAESLLEHLPDPARAVAEIRRVLKPSGTLYIVTPFMLGYHSSPHDYYRWTDDGMRELLRGFRITRSGSAWGPTASVLSLLGSWLALVLSFGIAPLHQLWSAFFLVLFGPLTYLDFILVRHPRARDVAHGLYFIAIKQ